MADLIDDLGVRQRRALSRSSTISSERCVVTNDHTPIAATWVNSPMPPSLALRIVVVVGNEGGADDHAGTGTRRMGQNRDGLRPVRNPIGPILGGRCPRPSAPPSW